LLATLRPDPVLFLATRPILVLPLNGSRAFPGPGALGHDRPVPETSLPVGLALAPPAPTAANAIDDLTDRSRAAVAAGLRSLWLSQTYDLDALTAWAAVGPQLGPVGIGTAVTTIHSRHPITMAGQARTIQAAVGNRFTLGIGVGHRHSVEQRYGAVFDHPAERMREYLTALGPLLLDGTAAHHGPTLTADTTGVPTAVPGASPPPVLVAALGPAMLRVTGELADGTVTWLAGPRTISEHVVPVLHAAARGRPRPRVVVGLPVCLTDDPDAARERAATALAFYGVVPSYRAVLDREDAAGVADVALIGDERELRAQIARLAAAGATELLANPSGVATAEEYDRTVAFLGAL
jgi:5,10-methylenetetrahydromethanopterin reductase